LWFGGSAQTRLAVKAALLVAAVLLSLAFVFYRLDYVTVGQHLVRTSNVGLGKPWLSWWWWSPEHNLSFNYGLDLFTYSFAAGVGAVTCWILFARIRSAERQQAVPRAAMTASPEQEAVRQQVAPVATALFLLGLVNCLLILGLGVLYYSTLAGQSPDSPESLSNRAMALLVSLALGLVSGALMIAGARMLRQMASRESAILACICAMIPPLSPTFLIGIPIAVWGLKVLRRPEVKAAFASQTRRPPFTEPPL
jgi:hypothetical protein